VFLGNDVEMKPVLVFDPRPDLTRWLSTTAGND